MLYREKMNDESARNASRLRMNAYVCSHALHGQFAHTLLAGERKIGYFLNRPRISYLSSGIVVVTKEKSITKINTQIAVNRFYGIELN